MAGGGGGGRELDQTPTWAVSLVCAIIIVFSILLETLLHLTAKVTHFNLLSKIFIENSINILFFHFILAHTIYLQTSQQNTFYRCLQ